MSATALTKQMIADKLAALRKGAARNEDAIQAEYKYGFINHLVFGGRRKIPVTFFFYGDVEYVWLDGGNVNLRIMYEVYPELMHPARIGSFKEVMNTYQAEAKALFAHGRIWQELMDDPAGTLLLFRACDQS